jgi:PAN domain-containing protein
MLPISSFRVSHPRTTLLLFFTLLTPRTLAIQCPDNNNQIYVTGGATFQLICNYDNGAAQTSNSPVTGVMTYDACANDCATTSGCVSFVWAANPTQGGNCYLKTDTTGATYSGHAGNWGGVLLAAGAAASISSASASQASVQSAISAEMATSSAFSSSYEVYSASSDAAVGFTTYTTAGKLTYFCCHFPLTTN